MLVSELVEALNKVKQVAGDVPVILKHLESEAETFIESIAVDITPGDATAAGSTTLKHTAAPTAVAPPVAAEPTPEA